ncbi:MAG: hypothetical protein HYR75_09340 [Gemmatimonadetes bacterium]|nr:hypothetical protein [Gemmatimonadota bacterium]MBI3568363.1 hypothetical protein [Gemmatimonadota bacterium]
MHVELLDTLRCPAPHEGSWLVATASRTEGRYLIEGTLGCPVCGAEYAIRDGAAWFGERDAAQGIAGAIKSEDEVTRLAALLGFDERGGLFLLEGTVAAMGEALADVSPARFILHAPPDQTPGHAIIRGAGDLVPLAEGILRGAAISRASGPLAAAAVRALALKGRLVAPADTPVPEGITILARDERNWVGERDAVVSQPVGLTRRR